MDQVLAVGLGVLPRGHIPPALGAEALFATVMARFSLHAESGESLSQSRRFWYFEFESVILRTLLVAAIILIFATLRISS